MLLIRKLDHGVGLHWLPAAADENVDTSWNPSSLLLLLDGRLILLTPIINFDKMNDILQA